VQREVIDVVDHNYLNDVLENPTLELIAAWIWNRITPHLPAVVTLRKVTINEGPRSRVEYTNGRGW
jgi:6-pyruvoyltetrahydropterin/6-carboxytetrahydropterin synthase